MWHVPSPAPRVAAGRCRRVFPAAQRNPSSLLQPALPPRTLASVRARVQLEGISAALREAKARAPRLGERRRCTWVGQGGSGDGSRGAGHSRGAAGPRRGRAGACARARTLVGWRRGFFVHRKRSGKGGGECATFAPPRPRKGAGSPPARRARPARARGRARRGGAFRLQSKWGVGQRGSEGLCARQLGAACGVCAAARPLDRRAPPAAAAGAGGCRQVAGAARTHARRVPAGRRGPMLDS
jgi:hypothetical protein